MIDDATEAIDAAAIAVQSAEAALAEAALADAAAAPQPSPDAQLAADMAIGHELEETERERIRARTEIKLAEIQAAEPPWLVEIRECLVRLETMVAAMSLTQSTQPPSVAIVEPPAPVVTTEPVAIVETPAEPAVAVATPASPEVPVPAAAEPARRKSRWI